MNRKRRYYSAREIRARGPQPLKWHPGLGRLSVWRWIHLEWDGNANDALALLPDLRAPEIALLVEKIANKRRPDVTRLLYWAALQTETGRGLVYARASNRQGSREARMSEAKELQRRKSKNGFRHQGG